MIFRPTSASKNPNRKDSMPPKSDRQLRTRTNQDVNTSSTNIYNDNHDSESDGNESNESFSISGNSAAMENDGSHLRKTKTGRISKALKGRKVHKCPHPQCGKVRHALVLSLTLF
jgi:hypothetical protein